MAAGLNTSTVIINQGLLLSYPFIRMAIALVSALRSARDLVKLLTSMSSLSSFSRKLPKYIAVTSSSLNPLELKPLALPQAIDCWYSEKSRLRKNRTKVSSKKDGAEFRLPHMRELVKKFMGTNYEGSYYESQQFVNGRGERIFTQKWIPSESGKLRAAVVLLHGLNEHSGRYENFADSLSRRGYGVFGMDWIGHGCSDGLHGYVERLDHVVDDVKAYIKTVKKENPTLPVFLFGHSTGGSIVLKVAMLTHDAFPLAGVIMTSPALSVEAPSPALAIFAPIASALFPTYPIPTGPSDAKVSRDPLALEAKYSDPLVYTGPIRMRTGWEILTLASDLQRSFRSVNVPFAVLHGADDRVTEPRGSKDLYQQASSKHKKLFLYEGLLHDLLFEPEKASITEDILAWMDERMRHLSEKTTN